MKNTFTLLVSLFIISTTMAQSPQKFSYQAVIRDAENIPITDQILGVQVSILQDSVNGTAVYVETHAPISNGGGLIGLEIGMGDILLGDFATIDWADGPWFIKTETDPTGGDDYSISGTSEFLSVPFALYALNSPQGAEGPMGPQGPAGNDGADGAQGPQGIAGLNGEDGASGPEGPVGPQGLQGTDGANGAPGPQGPTGNVGPVGAMGPQGLQGIPGEDGAVGPMGPQGIQGLPGIDGEDGAVGAVGPQGPAGNNGATGVVGPMGPQGIQGLPGIDGEDGAVGAVGPMGPQGIQGLTGNDGKDGTDGAVGAVGPQGPAGNNGADGAVGAVGPQGPAGNNGLTTSVNGVQQVSGNVTLTKTHIGLSNVDNSSDINKPVSAATQTALNAKANLASPALTGTPTVPTAAAATNNTQIASTAYVTSSVNAAKTSQTIEAWGTSLNASNSGAIFYSQHNGFPAFPATIPSGHHCEIVNYSNGANTLTAPGTARFHTPAGGSSTTYILPVNGSIHINAVTISGATRYYVR